MAQHSKSVEPLRGLERFVALVHGTKVTGLNLASEMHTNSQKEISPRLAHHVIPFLGV